MKVNNQDGSKCTGSPGNDNDSAQLGTLIENDGSYRIWHYQITMDPNLSRIVSRVGINNYYNSRLSVVVGNYNLYGQAHQWDASGTMMGIWDMDDIVHYQHAISDYLRLSGGYAWRRESSHIGVIDNYGLCVPEDYGRPDANGMFNTDRHLYQPTWLSHFL